MENVEKMNPDFWKGKKVFLTGHTGFKGVWLTLLLKSKGAEVYGYSLKPDDLSLYNLMSLKSHLSGEKIEDIRNLSLLNRALNEFNPDFVFHLAAQALVRRSYVDPLETYGSNVLGTANVLEACRNRADLKSVVVVTTDKVYENNELGQPFSETDPLGGHDPYSTSKACAELVTQSYIKSFFQTSPTVITSARAGNVIGGGDFSEDRLIPDIVRAISTSSELSIRSPGSIRPWQHVLEPLSGYLSLAQASSERRDLAGSWNFGPTPQSEKPVRDIVEVFRKYFPSLKVEFGTIVPHLHEAQILKLDITKAQRELNWHPILNFDETLDWTAEWYLHYLNKSGELFKVTQQQILNFQQL